VCKGRLDLLRCGGETMTTAWEQANFLAILIDEAADAWHSGHANDVLALDANAGLVMATDSQEYR
jgi:hypothetical protein